MRSSPRRRIRTPQRARRHARSPQTVARARAERVEKSSQFFDIDRADLRRRSRDARIVKSPQLFNLDHADPSAGGDRACQSALALAPCDFLACEMVFGCCLVACAPAFAIPRSRVRFAPGPIATSQYEGSKAKYTFAAPAGTSTKVVREVNFRCSGATFEHEVHFRGSGWKIATFTYESSTQSTLAQLRLENCNFEVRKHFAT